MGVFKSPGLVSQGDVVLTEDPSLTEWTSVSFSHDPIRDWKNVHFLKQKVSVSGFADVPVSMMTVAPPLCARAVSCKTPTDTHGSS